jgi:hypothetical protein
MKRRTYVVIRTAAYLRPQEKVPKIVARAFTQAGALKRMYAIAEDERGAYEVRHGKRVLTSYSRGLFG